MLSLARLATAAALSSLTILAAVGCGGSSKPAAKTTAQKATKAPIVKPAKVSLHKGLLGGSPSAGVAPS